MGGVNSGVKFRRAVWQRMHLAKSKHRRRIHIIKSSEMSNTKYCSSWVLLL